MIARLESWYQRHQDVITTTAAIVLASLALCIATGVVGPTLDARAEQHVRQ